MSLATFAAFEIPLPWSELLERTARHRSPGSAVLQARRVTQPRSSVRRKGPKAQVSPHAS